MSNNLLNGFDASHYQGRIDWPRVQGQDFAIFKATEGTGFIDSYLVPDLRGAQSRGIKASAYHFARPDQDPVAQAKHFVEVLSPVKELLTIVDPYETGRHLVALDVEPSMNGKHDRWTDLDRNERIDWIRQFNMHVEPSGYEVMIYCSPQWWAGMIGTAYGDRHLWAASYSHTPKLAGTGWSDWLIWQCDQYGTIPGVGVHSVDRNVAKPKLLGR